MRYHGYIVPMLYFSNNDFYPFVLDWQERPGKGILSRIGAYRLLTPRDGRWMRFSDNSPPQPVGTQGVYFFATHIYYRTPKA